MAKKPAKSKKAAAKPPKQEKKDETPGAVETTDPKQGATASNELNLDSALIKQAIEEGQEVLKGGKSKADAAWAIYGRLKAEDKDVIVAAFVKGATLTEKGALTYWYNCRKREAREAKAPA